MLPQTLLCFATLIASACAVLAPAGQKMIYKIHTSSNTTLCLMIYSDLSVSAQSCGTPPETLAWVSSAGSSAAATPPLGPLTHQFIPTAPTGRNGTYCLAANSTASTAAGVADGTTTLLKPCLAGNVMQQWGLHDADGTIRLGSTSKCLNVTWGTNFNYSLKLSACATGSVNQKWAPTPKPPSRGLTGFEPGTYDINIFQTPTYAAATLYYAGSVFYGAALRSPSSSQTGALDAQNMTLVAGSSLVGKGAAGPITMFNGQYCVDVLSTTVANVTTDRLGTRFCDGSATQQWQVNSDSTINIAGTNKCVGQATGNLTINAQVLVSDCVPGSVGQLWDIFRYSGPV
ncbi:hypothetical protein C8R46DRAFT_1184318 [Mycena filopes]|nr:hypothetical protein C8R46DRAFT_1184318 [Mycena filopes]